MTQYNNGEYGRHLIIVCTATFYQYREISKNILNLSDDIQVFLHFPSIGPLSALNYRKFSMYNFKTMFNLIVFKKYDDDDDTFLRSTMNIAFVFCPCNFIYIQTVIYTLLCILIPSYNSFYIFFISYFSFSRSIFFFCFFVLFAVLLISFILIPNTTIN